MRRFTIASLAVCVMLLAAPVAQANTTKVGAYRTNVVHASASTCWSWTIWRKLYNGVGATLAKYTAQVNWCGSASNNITSRGSVNPFGSVFYLGWSYKGQTSYWNLGGVGLPEWTHFTQGSFDYTVPVGGTIQHWYPYLESHAWGSGKFTYSTG